MFLGRCANCFLSPLLFTARMCIITQTALSDPTCCQTRTASRELSGPEALMFTLIPTIEAILQRATKSIKFIIFKTSHANNALNQFNPFEAILLHPLADFLRFSRSVNRRGSLGLVMIVRNLGPVSCVQI